MLTITRDLYDAIVAHAYAEHPVEACGIVAGADRPTRHVPMANVDRSRTTYRFGPFEQLCVWREMDERGEDPLIVYHSHTAIEAYPSGTDIAHATEPGAHYVIVSTRDVDGLGEFQFRSFRIADGEVVEEGIEFVPAVALQRTVAVLQSIQYLIRRTDLLTDALEEYGTDGELQSLIQDVIDGIPDAVELPWSQHGRPQPLR